MTDAPTVRIVTLTQSELEDLMTRSITAALDRYQRTQVNDACILSPRQVARMAKIRDVRVYAAVEAGQLAAARDEGGRYHITVEDAKAWIVSLAKYGR
jgi:hypothetical protein